MTQSDSLKREILALRQGIATLNAALLPQRRSGALHVVDVSAGRAPG